MKEDIKKKLMDDMWAKGIDIGVLIKPEPVEWEMQEVEELPEVDLMASLEEMKPMLMAATPDEKLDFLYAVLEACRAGKDMEEMPMPEEVVDGADIPL